MRDDENDDLVAQLLMFVEALERLDSNKVSNFNENNFNFSDISNSKVEAVTESPNLRKRKRDFETDSSNEELSDDIDSEESLNDCKNSNDESFEDDMENDVVSEKEGEVDNVNNTEEMITSNSDWSKLTFDQRLKQLELYKRKYGHCKVPQLYKENPSMGLWVRDLRVKKRKGKLPRKVEKRLTKLGFVWNCRKRKKAKATSKRLPWNDRFSQLKIFYEKNNHCKIPSNHKNKQLYHWVTNQRRDYRCGVMPYSRIKKLESIGFEWKSQRKRKKFKPNEEDSDDVYDRKED